jgi:hypothetical protein
MGIWQLALARRSRALLPGMEPSNRSGQSSTVWLPVTTKLDRRCWAAEVKGRREHFLRQGEVGVLVERI